MKYTIEYNDHKTAEITFIDCDNRNGCIFNGVKHSIWLKMWQSFMHEHFPTTPIMYSMGTNNITFTLNNYDLISLKLLI